MAKTSDFMVRSASLNHEAGRLEVEALTQKRTGALWHSLFAESFNKLSDEQIEADYHFQLANTAERRAKTLRKEANNLERKAQRIARRRGTSVWLS